MTAALVVAPIVVPLLAAAIVFTGFRSLQVQRAAGLAGAFALLIAGFALAATVWTIVDRLNPMGRRVTAWPPAVCRYGRFSGPVPRAEDP